MPLKRIVKNTPKPTSSKARSSSKGAGPEDETPGLSGP